MKYAFFPGCLSPSRIPSYELATRKIAEKLGIELVDLEGANCCGYYLMALDHFSALALGVRNLSLAEDLGLDILTICTGCFSTLNETNNIFKENKEKQAEVNKLMKSIGREYKGNVEIKHLAKVLLEDIGLEKIRESIKHPLEGLKLAIHPGCHLVRPSDHLHFGNPEDLDVLRELVKVTGAEVIEYPDEMACCGFVIFGVDRDASLKIAGDKLRAIKSSGADAIITFCGFCTLMFDRNQPIIEKFLSEKYDIPVLLYPQLLGLALGIKPEDLGIDENRVKPKTVLEALKEEG
ncbi:MAG: CoB--CoM heterodisulfide reductase iron-sulfur subunit B family protein [Candidatus Jordarchaeaceae archaeon]